MKRYVAALASFCSLYFIVFESLLTIRAFRFVEEKFDSIRKADFLQNESIRLNWIRESIRIANRNAQLTTSDQDQVTYKET